ncbi:hypothetical protein G9A89_013712 [Geosiphon pyriformis]|nr:hypothetical protein G9A89_013712 [Geosiphon pyriformis]
MGVAKNQKNTRSSKRVGAKKANEVEEANETDVETTKEYVQKRKAKTQDKDAVIHVTRSTRSSRSLESKREPFDDFDRLEPSESPVQTKKKIKLGEKPNEFIDIRNSGLKGKRGSRSTPTVYAAVKKTPIELSTERVEISKVDQELTEDESDTKITPKKISLRIKRSTRSASSKNNTTTEFPPVSPEGFETNKKPRTNIKSLILKSNSGRENSKTSHNVANTSSNHMLSNTLEQSTNDEDNSAVLSNKKFDKKLMTETLSSNSHRSIRGESVKLAKERENSTLQPIEKTGVDGKSETLVTAKTRVRAKTSSKSMTTIQIQLQRKSNLNSSVEVDDTIDTITSNLDSDRKGAVEGEVIINTKGSDSSLEGNGEPNTETNTGKEAAKKLSDSLMRIWNSIKSCRDARGRQISKLFQKLPDKEIYPDYYDEIHKPIALDNIKYKIKRYAYPTMDSFYQDLELMFENAKIYNAEESQIYEDAVQLKKLARKLTGIKIEEVKEVKVGSENYDQIDEIFYEGEKYHIGDYVEIINPLDETKPNIGHIFRLWKDANGQEGIHVCWYYRPEQTVHQVTRSFFENEVFKTTTFQDYPINQVLGKCFVLPLRELQRGKPKNFEGKTIYVCESRYNEVGKYYHKIKNWNTISPEKVRANKPEMEYYPRITVLNRVPSPLAVAPEGTDGFSSSKNKNPGKPPSETQNFENDSDLSINDAERIQSLSVDPKSPSSSRPNTSIPPGWLPPETGNQFAHDEEGKVIWFAAPPLDVTPFPKPKHSVEYLNYLANQGNKQKKRKFDMEQINSLNRESTKGQYDRTNINQLENNIQTIMIETLQGLTETYKQEANELTI